MALERTLAIIKPDSTGKGNTGKILADLEDNGFKILAMRQALLTAEQAREFYAEHRGKPFYGSLVAYMISGPVVLAALEREDAVAGLREVMGATDPAEAAEGTIRRRFGESIERNAIHGAATHADAAREIAFLFREAELIQQ